MGEFMPLVPGFTPNECIAMGIEFCRQHDDCSYCRVAAQRRVDAGNVRDFLEKWRNDNRSNNVGRLLEYIAALSAIADGK